MTRRCAYGTTVWKDGKGSIISRRRTTLSYMERHLILQPWLRRVIYPSFASLDGMSGATIVNKLLPFHTIIEYLDGSWALPGKGYEMAQWVLKSNRQVVSR